MLIAVFSCYWVLLLIFVICWIVLLGTLTKKWSEKCVTLLPPPGILLHMMTGERETYPPFGCGDHVVPGEIRVGRTDVILKSEPHQNRAFDH
jgi:hypothetical protein